MEFLFYSLFSWFQLPQRSMQEKIMKQIMSKTIAYITAKTIEVHPLVHAQHLIITLELPENQVHAYHKTYRETKVRPTKSTWDYVQEKQKPTFRYLVIKSTWARNWEPRTRFSNSQMVSMSTNLCFSSENVINIRPANNVCECTHISGREAGRERDSRNITEHYHETKDVISI